MTPSPTPLDLLSLAELRRSDPDYALTLATMAGKQNDMEMKDGMAANRNGSEGRASDSAVPTKVSRMAPNCAWQMERSETCQKPETVLGMLAENCGRHNGS